MVEQHSPSEQDASRSGETKWSQEAKDFYKEIAINFVTKDDLEGAKQDINKRIEDTQKWIWYLVIPLVLAILGLVVTIALQ